MMVNWNKMLMSGGGVLPPLKPPEGGTATFPMTCGVRRKSDLSDTSDRSDNYYAFCELRKP